MLDAARFRDLNDWSGEAYAVALGDLLTKEGRLDQQNLERAGRLARESGARLDRVLTQLGLISDRQLAEVMARMLGIRIAAPADYPQVPILPDRLKARFL